MTQQCTSSLMIKNNIYKIFYFIYIVFLISPSFFFYITHDKITSYLPFFILFQLAVLILPLAVFRYKTYALLLLPFFILTICQWGSYTLFRFELAEGAMISIVATNSNESSEFLTILPLSYFIFVAVSVILYLLLFFLKQPLKKLNRIQTGFFIVTAILLIAPKFYMSHKDGIDVLKFSYPSRNLISLYNTFELYKSYQNDLNEVVEAQYNVSANHNIKNTLHILVIGESSRRKNYSIYGYQRNTTPKLESIKDELHIFNNVYAAANSTIMSLRWTLSKKINGQIISIPSLFEKANFESLWLSNQGEYGENLNGTSALAKTASRTIVINDSDFGEVSYDKELIPYLMKEIKQDTNQFIVLHLLGSHFHYKRRYPNEFNLFDNQVPPGNEHLNSDQQAVINEYDNSIAYTDDLLATIINSLKTMNKPTTLTYFSDHGEILYDDGLDMYGHGGGKLPTAHELEIPFIFWTNDLYKNYNPTLNKNVSELKNKPFSSIDFIQLYVELLGLKVNGIQLPSIEINKIYVYNTHGEKTLYKEFK